MDAGTTVESPGGACVFVLMGCCGKGGGGNHEHQARDRVGVIIDLTFDLAFDPVRQVCRIADLELVLDLLATLGRHVGSWLSAVGAAGACLPILLASCRGLGVLKLAGGSEPAGASLGEEATLLAL